MSITVPRSRNWTGKETGRLDNVLHSKVARLVRPDARRARMFERRREDGMSDGRRLGDGAFAAVQAHSAELLVCFLVSAGLAIVAWMLARFVALRLPSDFLVARPALVSTCRRRVLRSLAGVALVIIGVVP
jgi:hypothetical protein